MPKVGKANYPYTEKGKKDALKHHLRTGDPISNHEYSNHMTDGEKVKKQIRAIQNLTNQVRMAEPMSKDKYNAISNAMKNRRGIKKY